MIDDGRASPTQPSANDARNYRDSLIKIPIAPHVIQISSLAAAAGEEAHGTQRQQTEA